MIQKITVSLILAALLFIGVILAQNSTPNIQSNSNSNNQSNSNTSNTIRADQEREKEFLSYLACQYLTKVDAKLILQSEVYGNGALSSYVDKTYFCNYSAAGISNKNQVSIRLNIQIYSTKPEADLVFAANLKKYSRIKNKLPKSKIGNVREIEGIGDKAKLIGSGDIASLYFQKDNVNFELVVYNKKQNKTLITNLKLLARSVSDSFDPIKAEQK